MSGNHIDRRSVLKGIGGIAASSALVTGSVSAHEGKKHDTELAEALHGVEQATAQFSQRADDESLFDGLWRAVNAGYELMGPYVPAMGWHLVNFDLVADDPSEVELTKPAGLTYNLGGKLGSVEYAVRTETTGKGPQKRATDPKPGLFPDVDGNPDEVCYTPDSGGERCYKYSPEEHGWHPHLSAQHVLADDLEAPRQDPDDVPAMLDPTNWAELTNARTSFPPERPGLEPGQEIAADFDHDGDKEARTVDKVVVHDDWWTLHAWVHYANSHGVFAGFNPNFDQFRVPGGHGGHEH